MQTTPPSQKREIAKAHVNVYTLQFYYLWTLWHLRRNHREPNKTTMEILSTIENPLPEIIEQFFNEVKIPEKLERKDFDKMLKYLRQDVKDSLFDTTEIAGM